MILGLRVRVCVCAASALEGTVFTPALGHWPGWGAAGSDARGGGRERAGGGGWWGVAGRTASICNDTCSIKVNARFLFTTDADAVFSNDDFVFGFGLWTLCLAFDFALLQLHMSAVRLCKSVCKDSYMCAAARVFTYR